MSQLIYLLIFNFLTISSLCHAGQRLFNAAELKRLDELKNSSLHLLQNQKDIYEEQVKQLFYSQLMMMSKFEIDKKKKTTVEKELERFDQQWLFNRLIDRKLKQLWNIPRQ